MRMHCIDKNWVLKYVLMDFQRFTAPHNGATTSTILIKLPAICNLLGTVRALNTDNDIYSCSSMVTLTNMLNISINIARKVTDIHVRCIAHIVNLEVSEF